MLDSIDPKEVDFFLALSVLFGSNHRVVAAKPLEYFLNNDHATRIKAIEEMTGLSATAVLFLYEFKDVLYFKKYIELMKFIPESLLQNKDLFVYVFSSAAGMDFCRHAGFWRQHHVVFDYAEKIVMDIGEVKDQVSRKTLVLSANSLFCLYLLFAHLNLPLKAFKYYKPSHDMSLIIKSLGYDTKVIMKLYLNLMRKHLPDSPLVDEILNVKFMNNAVDVPGTVGRSILCAEQWVSNINSKYATRRLISYFQGIPEFEDIDLAGMDGFVLSFYFDKYRGWIEGFDKHVMEDGYTHHIHRHTVIERYKESMKEESFIGLPASLNVKPSDFFKEFSRDLAIREYRQLQKQWGDQRFKDMDHLFGFLDSSKYRYLQTPVELVMEGRHMQHCVGGSNYIYICQEEQTFIMHYSDGSKCGYTFELRVNDNAHAADQLFVCDDFPFGMIFIQLKGPKNQAATAEVERTIITDLIVASLKFEGLTGKDFEDEFITRKVKFAMKYKSLRGMGIWRLTPTYRVKCPFIRPAKNRGVTLRLDDLKDYRLPTPEYLSQHQIPRRSSRLDMLSSYTDWSLYGNSVKSPVLDILPVQYATRQKISLPVVGGREGLVIKALTSLKTMIQNTLQDKDTNSNIFLFGCNLLANRIRYGLMSEQELRVLMLQINHYTVNLFNSDLHHFSPSGGLVNSFDPVNLYRHDPSWTTSTRPPELPSRDIIVPKVYYISSISEPMVNLNSKFNIGDSFTCKLIGGMDIPIYR